MIEAAVWVAGFLFLGAVIYMKEILDQVERRTTKWKRRWLAGIVDWVSSLVILGLLILLAFFIIVGIYRLFV